MRNLKRALSLLLSSTMVLGMMVMGGSAVGYQDVDDSNDHQEAIEVLQAVGIMSGVDEDNFDPDGSITRNQMAVIMAHLLNLNYDYYRGTNPFTDVPEWAAPYVAACAAEGVVAGIGDGKFGGDNKVTAAQASLMIMKALGYFQNQEDFGDDWQVATIRQASYIDLFDKIDSNAESALTRAQVAQLVLNGLQSDMVEFTGDKGIQIGNVTVGYKAEYTSKTSAAAKYNTLVSGTTDIANNNQYYIQLGEELYNGKLTKVSDSDAFGRPAFTWNYNSTEIGTYVDYSLMVKEDTTSVKCNDVYNVLGSTVLKDSDLTVYVDGVARTDVIDKNDLARTNKVTMGGTGNGVLTQVFYNDDSKEITIVEMNTYLAKATSDYNEKTDKLNLTVYGYNKTTKQMASTTAPYTGITSQDIAAVADCKNDDFLLVTIADGKLQTIATPDSSSNVAMTTFVKGSSVGNSETTYKFAESLYYDPTILQNWDASNMANQTYNVYMDQYGYLVGIELYKEADNYVFITGYDFSTSSIASSTVTATGIFVDGAKKTIAVNAEKGAGTGFNVSTGNPIVNQWYTYSVNSDNVYTLTLATNQVWDKTHDIKSAYVGLQDSATSSRYYYGNNDTNYILVDQADGLKTLNSKSAIYKIESVISGVKNVNIDVLASGDSYGSYAIYNSQGYIIAAVVVGDNLGLSQNYAYVVTGNPKVENIRSDSEGYWYWDFEVITKDEGITTKTVKGEFSTLTSIIPTNGKGLYTFTYDADGYVVDATPVTADINNPASIVPGTTSDMKYTTNYVLNTDGETLYADITGSSLMRGFALAAGYKIYTVERLDNKLVAQDWNGDAIAAVTSLALNNVSTSKDVYALFNSNGEATTVVIVIDTNYNSNQGGNWGNNGNLVLNGLTFASTGMQVNITNKTGSALSTPADISVVVKNADGNQVYAGAATAASIADNTAGNVTFGGFTSTPSNTGNYTVTMTVTVGGQTYTATATLGTV